MIDTEKNYTKERLEMLEKRLQALSDKWEEDPDLCVASAAIQDILDGLDPL